MSQSEVAKVVWPWREAETPATVAVAAKRRQRAALEALVMTGVGLLFQFVLHRVWPARIVLTLATVVLVGGLFVPPVYHGFHRAGKWLGKATGVAFAWLLLVPFFYICFPFGRLWMRLAGKDPLQRRFDSTLKTYWIPHPPASTPDRYLRQS